MTSEVEGFRSTLRGLMTERGMSLRGLARRVPVDPGQLSRVLNGKRRPTVELARRCDAVLGTGDLLTRAVRVDSGMAQPTLVPPAAGLGMVDPGHGRLASLTGSPGPATTHDAVEVRRALVAGAVHPMALAEIADRVMLLAGQYVAYPLAQVCHEVDRVYRDAMGHLETPHPVSQTRRAYLLACQASGLRAHVMLDSGDLTGAWCLANLADTLAAYAEDPAAQGWTRALGSLIAFWDHRPHDAAELAAHGLRICPSGANRARLHALRARALAVLEDRQGALASLDAAQEAHRGSTDQGATVASATDADPLWASQGIFGFIAAKRRTYAGTTLLKLDHPRLLSRAVAESTRALHLYQQQPDTERSSGDVLAAHLDLASAYVRTDEPEAAEPHLTTVAQTPPTRCTASIQARIRRFAHELAATPAGHSTVGLQMLGTSQAVLSSHPSPHV